MPTGGLRSHLMPFAGRRYWEERARLTLKAVVAAVIAWLIAKYPVGHPQPYFAPLAALLGVYPTVVRSVRESVAYGAGFVIGAGIAIPIGLVVGPTALGIAIAVVLTMMVSGWRRLGGQASQVPFTALFALLVGGHQVVSYTLPRLADVAIGLVVGLVVNAALFPPLYLRRGEYAVREARDALADALDALADEVAEAEDGRSRWDERESRLARVQEQARYSLEQGEETLRANPRAKLRGYPLRWQGALGRWPAPRQMNTIDHTAAYARSIAGTLRRLDGDGGEGEGEAGPPAPGTEFRQAYAGLLRRFGAIVRDLPGAPAEEACAEADRIQRELERPHLGAGTDAPGLWDAQKEVLRLSGLLLEGVRDPRP
ncbi:aromatic acid exporter family protein [Spirillospora sp. NPDC047418]